MNHLPLRSLIIEPEKKANTSLIGLHGLGASGEDFRSISTFFDFPKDWHVRMIFPHAMQIAVTVNNYQVMPAWYDIKQMSIEREVDKRSVDVSHRKLIPFIEHEIKNGIDSKRIILAGFSQGGAMACEVAMHFPLPLGGLIMLSSYLLNPKKIDLGRIPMTNQKIPIFMAHGKSDNVVPFALADKHKNLLKEKNYDVTWKNYKNMEHSVSAEEMRDLSQWLKTL